MVKQTYTEDKSENFRLLRRMHRLMSQVLTDDEVALLKRYMSRGKDPHWKSTDTHSVSKMKRVLQTALTFAESVDADHNILLAIVLDAYVDDHLLEVDDAMRGDWGDDVCHLLEGMQTVGSFSARNSVVNQDNYRGLLLALAKDIRVIIIMIVRSLVLMRMINHHPDEGWVRNVAFEANCLYAQLAHRLGLYKIKGELEDLSLKYSNREVYTRIARKLNETKSARDAYISSFITPVKEKLEKAGLAFEIKGRTKSISSIWAKIQKQKVDLSGIYDLFAIRVIIDTPREKEKQDCWLAYSILADMYTANPARMKDWISIPKSNGYESLHATVNGPGNKWVEVQFRTRRMDLVAEKGLAAHWRYKGGHSDSTDVWMNNIRDILETAESGPMELMKNMRVNPNGTEVFAFTPKGDLFRLGAGSTVLDFAFHIHTNVGSHCVGAVVNGRHEKINYRIQNGDTIEIQTSTSQRPKQDWLNIVVSSKARNKIRQSLNEEKLQRAAIGKEVLERRAKNRKIEIDEGLMMRLIKKKGYKLANDFFADMADEKVDAGRFLADYTSAASVTTDPLETRVSAEEFKVALSSDIESPASGSDEVLVIGEKSIKGLNYKFARCCNPIQGDDVFGFISSDGTVKIHKSNCPNARNIRSRYPYRLINVKWSGADGHLFTAVLRVVGTDDIGIVTNITSIINKEGGTMLRSISIDSHDGIFQGYLSVSVSDTAALARLVKKIQGVKGVKDVTRT